MRRGGRRRGRFGELSCVTWMLVGGWGRMIAGSFRWDRGESNSERTRIVGAEGNRSSGLVRRVNAWDRRMEGEKRRLVEA